MLENVGISAAVRLSPILSHYKKGVAAAVVNVSN